MKVKRYTVKRTESDTTSTDDPFLYGAKDVVLAADYDSLLELARRLRKAYINYRYEDDNLCGDSEWLEE